MRIRRLTPALAALFAIAACSSPTAPTPAARHRETSRLVAVGKAQVEWASQQADLQITQWTGLDVMSPSETPCRGWSNRQQTAFFDLNWRAARDRTPVASVTLTMTTPDGRPVMIAPPNEPCAPMTDYRIEALPPDPGEQFVLQLFIPATPPDQPLTRLVVLFDGQRELLPLRSACPSKLPESHSCNADPGSFDPGTPGEVRWTL